LKVDPNVTSLIIMIIICSRSYFTYLLLAKACPQVVSDIVTKTVPESY